MFVDNLYLHTVMLKQNSSNFKVARFGKNILVYDHDAQCYYCVFVQDHGPWTQLRVDKGREWYLMLFIQEKAVEQVRQNLHFYKLHQSR